MKSIMHLDLLCEISDDLLDGEKIAINFVKYEWSHHPIHSATLSKCCNRAVHVFVRTEKKKNASIVMEPDLSTLERLFQMTVPFHKTAFPDID